MATSAKKAESVAQTLVLKNVAKKQEKPSKLTKPAAKKYAAPTVKTVLSPNAAWPFPTGPRP